MMWFVRMGVVFVAGAVACGGSNKSSTGLSGGWSDDPGSAAPATFEDLQFTIGPDAVGGEYFAPDALARRSLPVDAMTSRTVADQRARYTSATGSRRVEEGEALAVLLFARAEDREQARVVLRGLASERYAGERTYAMLAVAEYLLGDSDAAAAQYDRLIAKFPRSASGAGYRARRGWLALVAGDNAGAASLVDSYLPVSDRTPAEIAYVVGWLEFRKGDPAAAYEAMEHAAKTWPDARNLEALRSELILVGAHAAIPPARLMNPLRATAQRDRADLGDLLGELAVAYRRAGHGELALAALELRVAQAPAEILAQIRLDQAQIAFELSRPAQVAELMQGAWRASFRAGGDLEQGVRDVVARRLLGYAQLYSDVYDTSGDARYGEAARALFAFYAEVPGRSDSRKAKARATELAGVTDRAGTYGDTLIKTLFGAHDNHIRGCYEMALQANAQLYGDVRIAMTFDGAGSVSAVSSEPAAGTEGLGAVAACITSRASGWTLPARGGGTTRVVAELSLAPEAYVEN